MQKTKKTIIDPLEDFHLHKLKNPVWNFEENEPTFSHLFRIPHPMLNNKNYGTAFFDSIRDRDILRSYNFLEIGAGLGDFAKSFISNVRGSSGNNYQYTILDLCPFNRSSER